MISIILNIVLAYLFMYLGGFVAKLYTKEEKQPFKHQVCLWWSAIIIPQATWLYIPVGFNVYFFLFAWIYFNVGYLLLTNNRFYKTSYSSEWHFKSNGWIFLTVNLLIFSFFMLTSTKFTQGEKFGNLIEVVEIDDPAAIEGTASVRMQAFQQAFSQMYQRIDLFLNLPLHSLERLALKKELDDIGKIQ